MKKNISILLLVAGLVSSSLTACGEKEVETKPVSDATAVVSEDEVPTTTEIRDDLGEYDFEGATFDMYTRHTNMFYPSMEVEESTGDVLSDAVYNRNRLLEERFHFVFQETAYTNTQEGNDAPRKLLAAGDDTYEIMVGRYLNMFNYAAEGMLLPTTALPNIDMTKPYWDAEMYENLSICGKHFFATGSFNLSSYDFTHALLFNKDMVKDHDLGDLYTIVQEGTWTFDRFQTMCETVLQDVDGDGVMGEDDIYGYTARSSAVMPAFWVGGDVQPVTRDETDALQFTALANEKFFDICNKVFAMTWNNNGWNACYASMNNAEGDVKPAECFRKNGALFLDAKLYEITSLRDSDVDFGIIPYPKYDITQKNYLSRMEGCELFGVPLTNTALEMTSTILEAMASESRLTVVPAYYEIMLKNKVSRDVESAAMLDLIMENLVFDAGDTLLGTEFRDGTMLECFYKNQQDVASALTKKQNVYQTTLDTYNEAFAALEE